MTEKKTLSAPSPRRKARPVVRIVKAFLLTLMGILLFFAGILICAVSILTPDRLTPIVEHVATRSLVNARVSADRVELSLRSTMPYLQVEVDNLTVHSSTIDSLAPEKAASVPEWADTVLSIRNFRGGVNIGAILINRLSFSDVILDRPMVNYVVVNDSVTNFNIFPPSEEEKTEEPFDWKMMPSIRIKRLAIVNPGPVRYLDVSTGTDFTVNFREAAVSGLRQPLYSLNFSGDVSSPMFMKYFTFPKVAFGMNGDIKWNQEEPWMITIDGMKLGVDPFHGTLSTDLDFRNGLVLNRLDLDVDPINVNNVLEMLADSFKTEYSIPLDIRTNALVKIKGHLTRPFDVGATSLPHCDLSMDIPDSRFAWGKAKFDNLAANLDVEVHGDDLNKIVVRLNRLNVRGPATDLTIRARVSNVMDDPLFNGDLKGSCDLAKLPPIILRYIPGSIRGRLTANASIKGRPSMLKPSDYHRLHVKGDLGLHNLYWISSDTIDMVYARHAGFAFGTDSKSRSGEGHTVDSLLTAKITVDTASILHSDVAMRVTDFRFNAGVVNRHRRHKSAARPAIIPMGGRLQIGSFALTVLTDTAMVRIRNVDGLAIIRAHNNDLHTPELAFNLDIGRFSAGDISTRMMFSKAKLNLTAFAEPQGRRAKAIKHIADSIAMSRPNIPLDSIYAIALRIHNSHGHSRYKRVHPRIERDSTEIIDFGTATGFKRILLGWNFKGELTAGRAGLFTPYFPVRNRLTNINVRFNNDSVIMEDIRYKGGHSDFTLSGVVSNMRRALTSRNGRQPLRVNMSLASDTVDVNQLAEKAFAGSAYSSAAAKGNKINLGETEDENELERVVLRDVQGATDSMAPFLIPQNIQAELTVRADNVVYSDLVLHNLNGKLLSYEGALNLHDLSANSDIGSVNLSALYVGRDPNDLDFGFGLKVNSFNLHRFLDLVPAIDSLMPIMRDFSGIIYADIAATSRITPTMDLDIPSLNAAIKLSGDSLVLLDPETFKMLSKWLFFKDKKKNVIDSMTVQMLVKDNRMEMFPFIFNFDRYKLGVQGTNDFAMNFKYHIAVLKSPIPFKFGINISGNPDKYKIRLGGAKLNEKTHMDVALVDTTRVNLVRSIENVFRRGVRNARMKRLNVGNVADAAAIDLDRDTLTHADSVMFIREGLIPAPDTVPVVQDKKKSKKSKKKKKSTALVPAGPIFEDLAALRPREAILPEKNRYLRIV